VLSQALAAATALGNDSDRAWALTGVAPHLPADQQPGVLSQALAAAAAISDDSDRAQALAELAPHLPADLLGQALAAAISDDYVCDRALAELAPYLPADLLGQALTAASEGSTMTLIALTERVVQFSSTVSNELLLGLLRSSFAGIDRRSCLLILSITAPQLKRIGGSHVISECVDAIKDIHHWWP
jgi:hypothetical protein